MNWIAEVPPLLVSGGAAIAYYRLTRPKQKPVGSGKADYARIALLEQEMGIGQPQAVLDETERQRIHRELDALHRQGQRNGYDALLGELIRKKTAQYLAAVHAEDDLEVGRVPLDLADQVRAKEAEFHAALAAEAGTPYRLKVINPNPGPETREWLLKPQTCSCTICTRKEGQ